MYWNIVIMGKQFNSPIERYGYNTHIVCDRCQTSPITHGYGYGTLDMCMPCVTKVKQIFQVSDEDQDSINSDLNCTMMQQEQFFTKMRQKQFFTNMRQKQFTPSDNLTFMMQDMFMPSVDFDNLQAFNDFENSKNAFPITGSHPSPKTNNPNMNEQIENRVGNGWSGLTRMGQSIFNKKNK